MHKKGWFVPMRQCGNVEMCQFENGRMNQDKRQKTKDLS